MIRSSGGVERQLVYSDLIIVTAEMAVAILAQAILAQGPLYSLLGKTLALTISGVRTPGEEREVRHSGCLPVHTSGRRGLCIGDTWVVDVVAELAWVSAGDSR